MTNNTHFIIGGIAVLYCYVNGSEWKIDTVH
ncbi:hypothetical protein Fluta_3225 [Fluviicola taffensis DSM 16823]|uniref:Uncharacterized protein n=1 Tax=Fluviicola taffensis (strain DSM 16823 / NCIMB 13979 / RW262) TaxID=755732 RepID=F2I9L7_FLUTR|nr:hypothetical protein Fluta_3225 [Fluviicola taffensis DSM 16823]